MNKVRSAAIAAVAMAMLGTYLGAQAPQGGGAPGGGGGRGPAQPMSFFITSVGKGDGANYGGLAGADAYCQKLGEAAGRTGVVWHAYLSTQGPGAVNARDRIGNGPWFNARGQRVALNVAELHGDTVALAQMGNALGKQISLTEKGVTNNGVGDQPNTHDILTGTQPDGRAFTDAADHTCNNWTSNADVPAPARGAAGAPAAPAAPGPSAMLGHSDKQGGNNGSWNASHASRGCSQPNLVSTGGAGLLYCFVVN
jgi:hypothetical protein